VFGKEDICSLCARKMNLSTHKHTKKNKAEDKGGSVRGERRVSIHFLIVRRIVVRLLRIKQVNEYRNSTQHPIQKFKCYQNM